MQSVAYVGLVASLVGTIAAWRLIGRFESTVDETLGVTSESLVTLEQTITVAEAVVASVDDALVAAETSLTSLTASVGSTGAVLEEIEGLATTVAPSIDRAVTTLDDVADVGRTIDNVLGQLDRIPFGPDYSPPEPLGEQLDQLGRDLEPVATALGDSSSSLSDLRTSTDRLETSVRAFADAISKVNSDLDESEAILQQYRATAERAQILTAGVQADLDTDVRVTRILAVIVGLAVAVGQIVPFWVGKELVAAAESTTRRPPDLDGI